jgi:hypothetical protein
MRSSLIVLGAVLRMTGRVSVTWRVVVVHAVAASINAAPQAVVTIRRIASVEFISIALR